MNLGAVKLFIDVADAGSLNKVAARRQTAQSHISRQVAEFEAACGGQLFRRTGRGVELTALGARALPRLRAWLAETEQITQELRNESGRLTGTVRLGVIPSAAHPLVTRLIGNLLPSHPELRLDVAEAQGAELDTMLDAGAVDMAVLFRFEAPGKQGDSLLGVADTFLVSAPGDVLTATPTLDFVQLKGLSLVLPRRPSHWRQALDDSARALGFNLQPIAEADSLTLQKELVAHAPGLYSVLGPYSIATELRSGRLQATRLVRPALRRHVVLALPRQGKLSAAGRVVAQGIRDLVSSWGDQLSEP